MDKLYLLILFLLIIIAGAGMVGKGDQVVMLIPLLFFLVGYWASTRIKKARKGDNNGNE